MNINNRLKELLLETGLSEAETLIYIELLKSPSIQTFDLVKNTNLAKSTVYRALDNLENLKIIKRDGKNLKALSLKSLVSNLKTKERKFNHLAYKIKQIAPFLHTPSEDIEQFEQLYTLDQLQDAYMFMSELSYNTNLDFGDFESFIPKIGGIPIALKFRDERVKHANHKAICTTFGPNTATFCTKESEKMFKNNVNILNIDFKDKWIIFSDNSDYLMYNYCDEENVGSLLIKSKPLADLQRLQFKNFSQMLGN